MEKIDIQSYMVGDWVMYNPNVFIEDEYEPEKSWYATTIANGADIDLAEERCYEPIPLTVEILEKNGFELADDTYTRPTVFYFSKDRRVQVSNLTNSGDGYWCVHVDNEDFETIGSCDVRFVHEIQHLLRLCKYELDFKI